VLLLLRLTMKQHRKTEQIGGETHRTNGVPGRTLCFVDLSDRTPEGRTDEEVGR
jgi:hypothetical protein